jgi:hypothetical protein
LSTDLGECQTGRKIIANIHDAVVINKRLGAELKAEIEMLLQEKTHNPYWRLGATQYERYNSTPKEVLNEEQLHRQRMAAEEEKAQLAEKAKRALQAQQAAK